MPDKENTINGLLEKHHAEIFNFPIVVSCMTHEEITEKETDFYRNNVMITKEAAIQLEKETRGQGHGKQRDMWLQARKIRITGSNSYGLYTYGSRKNSNWKQKIHNTVNNSFMGNASTKYGSKAERICKEFLKETQQVIDCGLLVHPSEPWMGCSPDGLILYNGEVCLLEIKCPVLGKSETALRVIPTVDYVNVVDNEYKLKKRHTYYGQVQLGLFLTSTKSCLFVIFCTYDKSYISVKVDYDADFLEKYLKKLKNVYFNQFLPFFNV
ncbi:uncharacterized protein LOC129221113 [Uloborus diversus]|uniref:uncharacterized protein LOC129218545 n=1 Tax=Uloborus diversus TaxID=327109 RepID=UPI00240989EC|nr:uncharacterized protein LOC129218545 [Uloborus diversus]XP_054711535.1 uncharacterized protein LOC129221113 [Uloborus diversus]